MSNNTIVLTEREIVRLHEARDNNKKLVIFRPVDSHSLVWATFKPFNLVAGNTTYICDLASSSEYIDEVTLTFNV